MKSNWKKYDGIILGMVAGLLASTPCVAVWFTGLLNSIIPLSWYVFGDWSLTIFGLFIGAIIGYIVDRTT